MSNLDKNSIINMENTASYQPRSNLNVVFSTADRDSAVFIFNVTKGNKPLLLSSENVIGHIALKHSDGSFVKDTLHFTEPDINGRFEYYIPNDILKREGTVTMQIFISEKGNSNVTVAERIVTFDIEKSIVGQISAETKLQYIVEYDELKAIIANRVTDIEDNMANAEDYVSQLKQAREKGLSDIEIAKADSEKALNDLADKRLEEISDKAREYSSKFDDDKQYMDDKHQEFKDSVLNSEVVTQGESKEWQKFKLTNNDGTRKTKSNIDILTLETGFYEVWGCANTPLDDAEIYNLVVFGKNGRKFILATQNYENRSFINTIHTNGDVRGWKELVSLPRDEEIETKNSAELRANETLTDANQYTDEQFSKQHTVLFEGSVNGVGQTINMTESMFNYNLIIVSGSTLAGDFDRPVLVNQNSGDYIIINIVNLVDSNGDLGSVYELKLAKTNETTLTIANDVFFDYGTNTGIGPNANRFTIKRIEGWK
ncbi:BppU family phage baseplate upper protein [Staphylococcus saprophyticus]|nr:BppU family phage baseplate upper protein [Staphylococcus saprophyticus]MDW4448419.1 BppU family phage baseplate upper protein [Staphylococcus saprophyticus]